MAIRTRFAPSPTGQLHIGGIRTALYCYALAKRHGGQFILRIEDTDQKRKVEGAESEVLEMLSAYGLEPDESITHGGEYGPYRQSERLDLYKYYADKLVEAGAAYYCFLSKQEEAELKEGLQLEKKPFRSPHRDLSTEEIQERLAAGESYVIRLKAPEGRTLKYNDGLQGEMKFETDILNDTVLLKQDGFPTYHLAVVVDDYLMEISHVFRGVEWIPSTPIHILEYEALGWDMPTMYHLPSILDPDKKGKLSKRSGTVSSRKFLQEGYLPEAVLNFLMLLGWSSPKEYEYGEQEQEIYSLQEFTDLFAVDDLNKSNPTFDREKLLWFNGEYIRNLDLQEFATRLQTWTKRFLEAKVTVQDEIAAAQNLSQQTYVKVVEHLIDDESLSSKLELVQSRAKTLNEIPALLYFFYYAPVSVDWDVKKLKKVDKSLIPQILHKIHELIASLPESTSTWQHQDWEQGMRAIGDEYEQKHGDIFMILRLAVVGSPFSPPLFECLQILGKEEVLARVTTAEKEL